MALPTPPARIRTDVSNPFAHHTMGVRVPRILEGVLEDNPDYARPVHEAVVELVRELREGRLFPELAAGAPHEASWRASVDARRGQGWQSSDWLFAENYAYRTLIDRVGYWQSGRDPFLPNKRREYASPLHAQALEQVLAPSSSGPARLAELLLATVFGNRIDLSFAASLAHGAAADVADLLIDERPRTLARLLDGSGPVHWVIDNAGTELSLDLVLVDHVLQALGAKVVLHLKVHPAFVSDATETDVLGFLGDEAVESRFRSSDEAQWRSWGTRALAWRERLRAALASGRLELASHPFWNGPLALWEMPGELAQRFHGARLVVLKGDAHYRRAVNDALWPADTPFETVTASFPAPLLALRALKSDAIVGLSAERIRELDALDPTWRVNGRRGLASLGGRLGAP